LYMYKEGALSHWALPAGTEIVGFKLR
jgi:hypothetical protein